MSFMPSLNEKNFRMGCLTGLLVWTVAFVAMVLMVIPYNNSEAKRAIACTEQHGAYTNGACIWTDKP